MKAVIWTAYGAPEVLSVQEVASPVPKPHEVLVSVHASAVTTGDCRMRGLRVPVGFALPMRLVLGLFKPRKTIPGMDFAGEVVAVGQRVTEFSVGDRVLGTTGMALGAHAQNICIGERKALIKLPDSMPYMDAAALVFGGTTALHFLQARVQPGMSVLINGACGAVGSAAVQLCSSMGALVTGVCSGVNTAQVLALGAHQVVDYTQQDFTTSGVEYDLVLDAVGNVTYAQSKAYLARDGRLILLNASLGELLISLFRPQVICGVAQESKALLQALLDAYQSASISPLIDRVYPLEEIVEAHRYVDTGRKRGNVVLCLK